jgi:hypothetical protein
MKMLSDLRAERNGILWCGPSLIARALTITITEAEQKYRELNPKRYGTRKKIKETFWHETVKIMEGADVLVPAVSDNYVDRFGHTFNLKTMKYPTLRQWINHAEYGWWAVRTSRHVQIIHIDWRGAHIHDNQRDEQWYPGMLRYSKIRCTHARNLSSIY